VKVFTTIFDKSYQTERKVAEDFKPTMTIVCDEFLPQKQRRGAKSGAAMQFIFLNNPSNI
jgi:hypothetical protein